MIVLPEHLLSFTLSGIQCLADRRLGEAKGMLQVQSWLHNHARDIIDESDFSLALRTQLIYPSGVQKTVDGHPLRWEIPEYLLRLVDEHLPILKQWFPRSIEIVPRTGFTSFYLIHQDVEDALLAMLVDDVCRV